MAKWNGIIAVGFSMLFSGCATSMKIHTDHDSSVRFADFKSFTWMTTYAGGGSAVGDRRVEELLKDTVPSAVRRLLTAKGYTEGSADSADFSIGFEVALPGGRHAWDSFAAAAVYPMGHNAVYAMTPSKRPHRCGSSTRTSSALC